MSIIEHEAPAARPVAALHRDHPGIPPAPRASIRAAIARRLFEHRVARLELRVRWPDGRVTGGGGPDAPALRLVRPDAFFHRLGAHVKIGFGEAYQAGEWVAESDLADVLGAFAARLEALVSPALQRLRRVIEPARPSAEENTVAGARENIQRHYDLSNDLFALFLDETMTYSAALYAEPEEPLEDAQRRKMDSILDMAGVRPGMHVLEVGTGWGGLAMHAARTRGCRVTTLTISAEQRALAEARIRDARLEERIEVRLEDYRDARGTYDAIVSVEMFEAVGERYWPTYFDSLRERLAPGGRAAVQTITIANERFAAYRRGTDFIQRHIFPGGMLPSPTVFERRAADAGLQVRARHAFGPDYAHTLAHWARSFDAAWPEIEAQGFDTRFRRLWQFYLAYCEAGFRAGATDVYQFLLEKPRT